MSRSQEVLPVEDGRPAEDKPAECGEGGLVGELGDVRVLPVGHLPAEVPRSHIVVVGEQRLIKGSAS